MKELLHSSSNLLNKINPTTSHLITNIENVFSKNEKEKHNQEIEDIYQKHLKSQEWGNKLNQETLTDLSPYLSYNKHKHRHQKNRNIHKRENLFKKAGNWIKKASSDTLDFLKNNAPGNTANKNHNWGTDEYNNLGNKILNECINDEAVARQTRIEIGTGGAVGGATGLATGGAVGGAVGAVGGAVGGAVKPCLKHLVFGENRKKRETIAIKSKWTDDLTKSINHKNHLVIDNLKQKNTL